MPGCQTRFAEREERERDRKRERERERRRRRARERDAERERERERERQRKRKRERERARARESARAPLRACYQLDSAVVCWWKLWMLLNILCSNFISKGTHAHTDGRTHARTHRERVLFIGPRFSNLYTSVDTPAEAA